MLFHKHLTSLLTRPHLSTPQATQPPCPIHHVPVPVPVPRRTAVPAPGSLTVGSRMSGLTCQAQATMHQTTAIANWLQKCPCFT